MQEFLLVGFLLLAGHAAGDYALQSDFMSQAKNRNTDLGKIYWVHVLPAHSLIHGGIVALITGIWWLGLLESIIHGVTDWLKCENLIGLDIDQYIHYVCKTIWFLIYVYLNLGV